MNDRTITIAQSEKFPEHKWREAIKRFLNEFWAGNPKFVAKPAIMFGNAVLLYLDAEYKQYFVRLTVQDDDDVTVPPSGSKHLEVTNSHLEVQDGLIRFVSNDQVRTLTINFKNGNVRSMTLLKTDSQDQYRCQIAVWETPTEKGQPKEPFKGIHLNF